MTNKGRYADGRSFSLPDGWPALLDEVLDSAFERARTAVFEEDALRRLLRYYDPSGDFASTSFLDAQPNPPDDIVPADLYAVSRLSMTIRSDQGRLLLDSGPMRTRILQLLNAVDPEAIITELSAELLTDMWNLYDHFRTLLSTADRDSNHWVFAAKLCARKRPSLFPVRDSKVCDFLAGEVRPKKTIHRIGRFGNDLQVFAYLMTDADFSRRLLELRSDCSGAGMRVDESPLRLLDVLLWMKATNQ
jgi:hypothetical protein